MLKKMFFKRNYFYGKLDPKPHRRLYEVCRTAWASKHILFNFKKINKKHSTEISTNWFDNPTVIKNSNEPVITWIGQATFLIQIGGFNILTDPIFSNLSPFYPRNFKPGIALKDLPKIDLILISHNHRDHMEKPSLKYLKKDKPNIFIGNGNRKWFDKNNFENVTEFDWWQGTSFEKLNIHFLPAIHWSGTGLHDINKSLWGSWMIEYDNFKIYFAGDTAYSMHFTEIAARFDNINLALMPIGPNEPRKFQQHSHVNTQESIQAFIDLKSKNFVPMHWGTYCLGSDAFSLPIEKLKTCWNCDNPKLKNKNLYLAKFGQQLKFNFE